MSKFTISQLKYQIEYFYLIPVNQIADDICSEISNYKNIKNEVLLDIVFKHVYKGASLYYDFIDGDIYHTFFKENPGSPLRCGLCKLLYFSIQNNCILNAYFGELASSSITIKLSGKNMPLASKYITDLIGTSHVPKQLRGEVDSQFFNNRKRIYKKDLSQGTYTCKIIESLNLSDNKNDRFPIMILQYLSPAANFLFLQDACSKFGRSLLNNENKKPDDEQAQVDRLLDKYKKVWNEYTKCQMNYSVPIDKLIFQSEIENIFGFSFFSSIYSKLDEIHRMEGSNSKCLKDLEGQPFNNIILQIANLPIFFGKSLFFRYICYAFESSENIDSSYFEEHAKDIATCNPTSLPKSLQIISGLELMDKFFTILRCISLPVLFSLWKVVIHELELRGLFTVQTSDLYKEYLEKNIDMLTYNYNSLSDDKITLFSKECLQQEITFDNSFLRSKLIGKNTTTGIDQKYIFPYGVSLYLKETMHQLLHDYCNLNSLKDLRVPLFFLSGDDLTAYNPLSSPITSLQFISKNYNDLRNYQVKSFLIEHRNSIYKYLFSKEQT